MYHRSKFELDPTSIKHFSRPRKVQAQYSAYIVNPVKITCVYSFRQPVYIAPIICIFHYYIASMCTCTC